MTLSTVQPIEVVWTVVAAVGLSASIWNVADAFRDLRDVEAWDPSRNGLRDAAIETAKVTFRAEALRGVQLVLLVIAGVLAMTLAPRETAGVCCPAQQTAIVAIFLSFGVLLTTNTVLGFFARRRILHQLRRLEREGS